MTMGLTMETCGHVTMRPCDHGDMWPNHVTMENSAELGLTMETCSSVSPRTKLRKVAENACPLERIAQFTQAGAQLDLLTNCDSSIRSAASGMRRWAFFRDPFGEPRIPPYRGGGAGLA